MSTHRIQAGAAPQELRILFPSRAGEERQVPRGDAHLPHPIRKPHRATPGVYQAAALVRVGVRHMAIGFRLASEERAAWRARAARIPDPTLRHHALRAIQTKRGHIHGAALFWTLPESRSSTLLRLLVAYDVMADYLDSIDEHTIKGPELQHALPDAFHRPTQQTRDYYRDHPYRQDAGYLQELLSTCQTSYLQLPSREAIDPYLKRAAKLTTVQALNHIPHPGTRDQALRSWAQAHTVGCDSQLAWFERTAAASSWLTTLALLALAADPGRTHHEAAKVSAAYLPWISLAGTMLDSYADATQDRTDGDHSYISHYPPSHATQRLTRLIARAAQQASTLPNAERHLLLFTSMTGMYLSKAASASGRRSSTHAGTQNRTDTTISG